ncbi:hypothetical protein ACO0KY_19500 [Undibacterium sp. Dicai25W]|uniref:hypothetical protein n=1 Tax=Undibacterium sp. Dicai25W TaxID=3413034 RepID=UPI003BF2C64E
MNQQESHSKQMAFLLLYAYTATTAHRRDSMNQQQPDQEQPGTPPLTETQALIQLIEMGNREFELGHYQDAESFFAEMEIDKD